MFLAASNPSIEAETSEVFFTPQFEIGTVLELEGFPRKKNFVKIDTFVQREINIKDGGFCKNQNKKIGHDDQISYRRKLQNGKLK